jgi:putative heme-binding domain-containing protein
VRQLLDRNLDARDPHLPLLLWWAVEEHAIAARELVMTAFGTADAWQVPLVRELILEKLMRRYAAEGSEAGYTSCARLLEATPPGERGRMLAALDQGLRDRPTGERTRAGTLFSELAAVQQPPKLRAVGVEKLPSALANQLDALWSDETRDVTLIRLGARLGRPAAHHRAIALAADPKSPAAMRLALLQALADFGGPACVNPLLEIVTCSEPEAIRLAALGTLQRFDQEEIATTLLRHYAKLPPRLRGRAEGVLLSRKGWAAAFLNEVDAGRVEAKDVSADQLRVVALYNDHSLDALVHKYWGNIKPGTPEEKLAEMRRLNNDLRAGVGSPIAGRELFRKHCAICHKLFGEGEVIGPDLTHANRKDRDYLLVSAIDPSAVIRKEYLAYNVQTTDGRALTGLIAEQTPATITLLDGKNQHTTIARDRIESLRESPISLMPEDLLKGLKPQELCDLFSYLQTDKPLP